MFIFCNGCTQPVDAVAVSGSDIYPHRSDLANITIFQCPTCKNYVGTHKSTGKPLGTIPTPELRSIRSMVHSVIDPIWRSKQISRGKLYKDLSEFLGQEYHTGNINSQDEADKLIAYVREKYLNE